MGKAARLSSCQKCLHPMLAWVLTGACVSPWPCQPCPAWPQGWSFGVFGAEPSVVEQCRSRGDRTSGNHRFGKSAERAIFKPVIN